MVAVLSGCTPAGKAGPLKYVREVSHEQIALVPSKGTTLVVFVRPKDVVNSHQAAIFEVSSLSTEPKLISLLAANSSSTHETQPGKHIFMSTGASFQADFITADLLPDTTYYVLVDAKVSNWGPARIFLKTPSADIKDLFSESRIVVKSAEADQWASDNMQSIRSKMATYTEKSEKGEVPHL
jgi:hypothetical protein